MNKQHRVEVEFRRDVATKIDAYIRQNKKTKAQAARELGISRQRLHRYLKRLMTPKSDFLCAVAKKWSLEFTYKGSSFAASAFINKQSVKAVAPSQLELFKRPQVFRNSQVEVRIQRMGSGNFDLSIEIKQIA